MNLTSKMRERQSQMFDDEDKLWLLTQDELQAAATLGVPVETIFGKRAVYTGDVLHERTHTIKFYNDGAEIAVTQYGVRESDFSKYGTDSGENIGLILRTAFEFASTLEESMSDRHWDLLPVGESSTVIDLEQGRDIARCDDHQTAQTIAMMKVCLPLVVETLSKAVNDHYLISAPITPDVRELAKNIVKIKQSTEDAR